MSVVDLVRGIVGTDLSCADTMTVARVLQDWRRVRNWGDSVEVAAARRLRELATAEPALMPEQIAADAGRVSLRDSSRRFDRARTTEAMPELGAAMEAGGASGAHVDAATAALRGLAPDLRDQFVDRAPQLAHAASELSVEQFAKVVRRHRDDVCRDGGVSRLERQKRDVRLKTWVDPVSGMWRLSGQYDPETGLELATKLRAQTEARFPEAALPAEAPEDPGERQQFLAAHALIDLCAGRGGRVKTEMVMLIDAKTLDEGEHDGTVVDVGLDLQLPVETIRRMACCTDVFLPVVTAANGVNLYLGREQPEPNKAQRRALRAMYKTCPVPGCCVPFDKLRIHHLKWWGRDRGRTDIDHLLPLCFVHHHAVHDGGWIIDMARDRSLTITLPDGTRLCTGPPSGTRVA